MAFRNIPLDLTLPPGGSLTPGSGTVYIGGPHLPTEIKALNTFGAIIFYSGSGDPLADYYYIAYFQLFGVYYLSIGYKRHSDGVLVSRFQTSANTSAQTYLSGPDPVADAEFIMNQVGISINAYDGLVSLHASVRNIIESKVTSSGNVGVTFRAWTGGDKLNIVSLGTNAPFIRADTTNTILDQWHTDTSTQTIGGVANFTVNQAWRLTPDYVIDYRTYITGPNPFPVANVAGYNLPASFPTVDSIVVGTGNLKPFIPASGEGGLGFYPMSVRFETNGTATIFLANNPQGNTALEGGGSFTIPKV